MFSCINWKGGFKIDNCEIIIHVWKQVSGLLALLEKLQPFYMYFGLGLFEINRKDNYGLLPIH